MSSETVLISVIIPSFGRSDFLLEAIQSVLVQEYPRIELIVVDDNGRGSEDQLATASVMQLDRFKGVTYLVNDVNAGVACSRNRGAAVASGHYLTFLDDDDVMEPQKLAVQLAAMQRSDVALSMCGYYQTDAFLNVSAKMLQPEIHSLTELLTRKVYTQASTLVVRRDDFLHSGGFPEDMSFREDTCLVFRVLALGGSFEIVHQPLFKHRSHVKERLSKIERSVEKERFVHRRFCEEQNRLLKRVPAVVRRRIEFRREYKFFRWKSRRGSDIQYAEFADLVLLAMKSGHWLKLVSIIYNYIINKIK
ncbi:glycosyltransferase family 2 protein [Carnimonas nigrificans]|uniref:glycosyltransferase family 2 protein n=1 Tax=Carnimonas nigrificans TaxID=64323 RepID=UPI0004707442|nr:glycosyltransferase family 2 protein [Carnimonas nigrificans]